MKKKSGLRLALGGAAAGLINGLLGGGGGMIAVPALQRAGMDDKQAHATAIAVILPVSLVSGAIYWWQGSAPLGLLLPVSLGVFLGGGLGAKLLSALDTAWVQWIFFAVMLVAGGRMLF